MSAVMDDKHKLVGRAEVKKNSNPTEKEKVAKTVNLLSKQAIGKMQKDNIPATPENFKVYFDNQLEQKSTDEKRKVTELLLFENEIDNHHTASLEKDIQYAFVHIKSMTESIATAYSSINQLRKITENKKNEIIKKPSATTLVSYEENLTDIVKILEKELRNIKNKYGTTAELIRDFNQNTIYDNKYSIYNKKYLVKSVQRTIESSESFEHANTLLALRIKPRVLSNIKHQNDKEAIKKTLAKLILKRSRRSDTVAHYSDGIFMIILKHATLDQSEIAIKRISEMIESANFIVNAEDLIVELDFGIAAILKDTNAEETIIEAVDNLS